MGLRRQAKLLRLAAELRLLSDRMEERDLTEDELRVIAARMVEVRAELEALGVGNG